MNYNQYLEDYWPEENPSDSTHELDQTYYFGQVTCIDRQIAELEARKAAILAGTCFTGHLNRKPYLDSYGLGDEELL